VTSLRKTVKTDLLSAELNEVQCGIVGILRVAQNDSVRLGAAVDEILRVAQNDIGFRFCFYCHSAAASPHKHQVCHPERSEGSRPEAEQ